MSLLIPQEFIRDISQKSGFLYKGSKFGDKTLKGLYMSPENQKYLSNELFALIINRKYVGYVLAKIGSGQVTNEAVDYAYNQDRTVTPTRITNNADSLTRIFRDKQPAIAKLVPELINSNPKDFWMNDFFSEDFGVNNPVQQLHHLNKKFLETNAEGFISNPSMLDADYYYRNPVTQQVEKTEYDFGPASYADGTWHPEHLFTESARNRKNPYWTPREVMFDTNPPHATRTRNGFRPYDQNRVIRKEGYPDHVSKSRDLREEFTEIPEFDDMPIISADPYLDDYTYGPGPGAGNKYAYDSYGDNGFSKGGTFPAWQYTVNYRPYQRNIDDGLREGGISDRRVNSPRRNGYDMSALISKSTY